ncbi:craniofacial development protein 2-like [Penaeus indicus]|uniref:craniofacial development protein 2-like n=1 Tax=Penaeus indicus TaxID=29960 RepID=UPI00300C0D2F
MQRGETTGGGKLRDMEECTREKRNEKIIAFLREPDCDADNDDKNSDDTADEKIISVHSYKANHGKKLKTKVRKQQKGGPQFSWELLARKRKISILGLAEMRWKGPGHKTSDGYKVLYSGGDKHDAGVGIILDSETAKAIKGYWSISERVILVKLQGTPFDIGIIQTYAPTADKDDEEVEEFFLTQ